MGSRLIYSASIGVVAVVNSALPVRAGFLDVQTLMGDLAGTSFVGSLDGVGMTGIATSPDGFSYSFTPASTGGAYSSTTDSSSTQYSYTSVYSPVATLTDRVGYAAFANVNGRLTITFDAPMTDLRFHVAHLDGAAYAFDLTGGLTGVSLVSGNGGNGDGLQVVGSTVSDINPATFGGPGGMYGGTPPTSAPPTTGARPAYGTVSLNGTYTTLTATVTSIGDTGSFTLSSVPEPTAMAAVGTAGLALLCRRGRPDATTGRSIVHHRMSRRA